MPSKSKYACPECDGRGSDICPCCLTDNIECEDCDGTGLDGNAINYKAFEQEAHRLRKMHGGSWLLVEGDVWVGYNFGRPPRQIAATLLIEDYTHEKVAERSQGR